MWIEHRDGPGDLFQELIAVTVYVTTARQMLKRILASKTTREILSDALEVLARVVRP